VLVIIDIYSHINFGLTWYGNIRGTISNAVCKKGPSRDELVAPAASFLIARAAYDTAVSLWPRAWIELRQGARVVLKNGEQPSL
jgi:hypothetical protein